MKENQLAKLMQGGASGLDEKTLWKERLRKEILEEEKKRIIEFVESEVTKKVAEIEKLLEIAGKPAKLVFLPIDGNVTKLNTGNGISASPATMDGGANGGSELGLSSEQDDPAEHSRSAVEEAKAEKKASEGEQHLRPRKRQKTGSVYSCPLCDVTTTSKANLDKHLHGKKHKHKQSLQYQKPLSSDPEGASIVKESNTKGLAMNLLANGKLFVVHKKGNSFWCGNSNCNFTCADSAQMVLHLTETEHEECKNGEDDEVVAKQ